MLMGGLSGKASNKINDFPPHQHAFLCKKLLTNPHRAAMPRCNGCCGARFS
jgi:hypothetical protein